MQAINTYVSKHKVNDELDDEVLCSALFTWYCSAYHFPFLLQQTLTHSYHYSLLQCPSIVVHLSVALKCFKSGSLIVHGSLQAIENPELYIAEYLRICEFSKRKEACEWHRGSFDILHRSHGAVYSLGSLIFVLKFILFYFFIIKTYIFIEIGQKWPAVGLQKYD